jgi:hypothetical protein
MIFEHEMPPRASRLEVEQERIIEASLMPNIMDRLENPYKKETTAIEDIFPETNSNKKLPKKIK